MSVARMEMEVDGITSDAVVNPWQSMKRQKRARMPQDDFYLSSELGMRVYLHCRELLIL